MRGLRTIYTSDTNAPSAIPGFVLPCNPYRMPSLHVRVWVLPCLYSTGQVVDALMRSMRCHWHRGIDVSASAIAVGFLTSAVSVWSELYGRRYGGGVLKIEPGTLNRTPVPVVRRVECAFDELNKLIRCGQEDDARALADDLVLGDELGLSKNDIRRLQRAGRQLMIRRSPVRKGNGRG